jgi:hypothetical protein
VSAISGTSSRADFPGAPHFVDDLQVDLGLARARDALKQEGRRRAATHLRLDRVDGHTLLVGGNARLVPRHLRAPEPIPGDVALLRANHAALLERANDLPRVLHDDPQLGHGNALAAGGWRGGCGGRARCRRREHIPDLLLGRAELGLRLEHLTEHVGLAPRGDAGALEPLVRREKPLGAESTRGIPGQGRRRRAQHFAHGVEVIVRRPQQEPEELRREYRQRFEDAGHVSHALHSLGLHARTDHEARELLSAEGHRHSHARKQLAHHGPRYAVRKRLSKGDRHRDLHEEVVVVHPGKLGRHGVPPVGSSLPESPCPSPSVSRSAQAARSTMATAS